MAFTQGDSGPNVLVGGPDNDIIWGLGGNDTITGGLGNDDLDGGLGMDTAVLFGTKGQYSFSMVIDSSTWRDEPDFESHFTLDVVDSIAVRDGSDMLDDIEFLQFANGTVNWYDVPVTYTVSLATSSLEGIGLYGGVMNDTMTGHAGANNFIGGLGDDSIDGGPGFDTVIYLTQNTYVTMAPVVGGVRVSLETGSVTGVWGADTLSSIEAAVGTNYNDTLIGNAGPNFLNGAAGNDILVGNFGDDTIDGWDGLDYAVYEGNASQFTLSGDADQRHVLDNLGGSGNDVLENTERLQFDDKGFAFDIDGNAGNAARLIGVLLGGAAVQDEAIERLVINALDNGYTQEEFADIAIDYLYPNYTPQQLATMMFQNVVNAAPTQAQVNVLVDAMAQHSAAWLAVYAGDTVYNDNNIDLAGLVEDGVPFLPIV